VSGEQDPRDSVMDRGFACSMLQVDHRWSIASGSIRSFDSLAITRSQVRRPGDLAAVRSLFQKPMRGNARMWPAGSAMIV